jgi:phytoene/squalene synthetase
MSDRRKTPQYLEDTPKWARMLAALYGDILARIEDRGFDYTHGRVSLPGRRKAALMLGSIARAIATRRR